MMNNRTTIASLLALSAVAMPSQSEAKSKPNILFIFADDMRYDGVHALGNTAVVTPNLDQIVKNGVSFDNAYLQGANTGATSMASRAQLLTGRGVFGIIDGKGSSYHKEDVTLAMALKDAGYHTFFTGKSHNGAESSSRGFMSGGMLYGLSGGFYNPHFGMAYQDYREDQKYHKDHLYFVAGENFEGRIKPSTNPDYEGPHSTDIFAHAALEFLKGYDKDQPFMMYLAFHAAHDTRNYPEEYKKMYDPEKLPLPVNFLPGHPFDNGDLYVRDELLGPFPRTESNTKSQLADYYRIITHMDDRIGEILQVLKDKGMDKNTLIVFSTDSGLGMGSHGLYGKQNLYDDAGIRVPMVFSGAGLPKGKRQNDICYSADIFPTICGLVGAEIPSTVLGLDQSKSVRGKSQNLRKEGYFAYRDTQRAIRNERYKLIEYCVNGERHTQLFDLLNDRYECNDLSKDPKYADIIANLQERLVAHSVEENGATWGIEFWRTYMSNYRQNVKPITAKK